MFVSIISWRRRRRREEEGGQTLHFEVLVAFAAAETEFFGVVADKHDPMAWIYGARAVHPHAVSTTQSNSAPKRKERERKKENRRKWDTMDLPEMALVNPHLANLLRLLAPSV